MVPVAAPFPPSSSVRARRSIAQAVAEVLERFRGAGFHHVMVSLLDLHHNTVSAVAASGDLGPLVHLTHRCLRDYRLDDADDVLVAVVKTGAAVALDDCLAPHARCDQAAIRYLNPPLDKQLVFPLKADRTSGWPTTNVFGTVQVGRLDVPASAAVLAVLRGLVDDAAEAIDDARLFEEREQLIRLRGRQIDLLRDVSRSLGQIDDGACALDAVLRAAVAHTGAMAGSIRLYDPTFGMLVFRAVVGERWTRELVLRQDPLDDSTTAGWVVQHGQPVLNPDVNVPGIPCQGVFAEAKSNCGIPISVRGKVEGALVLDADRPAAFTVEDTALLQALADLLGSRIAASRDQVLAQAVSGLATALSRSDSWGDQLQRAVEVARRAVRADHCSLFLPAERGGGYVLHATTSEVLARKMLAGREGLRYRAGEGRTGYVARRRRSLRVRAHSRPEELLAAHGAELRVAALHNEYENVPDAEVDFLAVPVVGERDCWGVLRCVSHFQGQPQQLFAHEDQQVLELLGRELGAIMDRKYLQKMRLRDQWETALEAARSTADRVAHKLKNPTNGLRLCVDNYLAELERGVRVGPDRLREHRASMEGFVGRIRAIVEELNRPLLTPTAQPRPTQLPELVRRLILAAVEGSAYTATFGSLPRDWPCLPVDESLCRAVLEELVRNAQLAMPKGGDFHIDFTGPHESSAGPVPTMPLAYVTVAVSDSGPGVPREHKETIFWGLGSTRAGGSGLGLPIVRQAMSAMGGQVIEDGPGPKGGACFRLAFHLPLQPEVQHAIGQALLDDACHLERVLVSVGEEFGMERDPAARYRVLQMWLTNLLAQLERVCDDLQPWKLNALPEPLTHSLAFLRQARDTLVSIERDFASGVEAIEKCRTSLGGLLSLFARVRGGLLRLADEFRQHIDKLKASLRALAKALE